MTLVGMSGRVGALAPARHARRVRLPEAFFPPGERGLFSTVRPKTLKKKSPRRFSNFSNLFLPRGLGHRIDCVCGTADYPPPDLPREASRSRSAPEKSKLFGPDGAPFPAKTPTT